MSVFPRGSRWCAQFYDPETRKQRHLGTFDTEQAARDALKESGLAATPRQLIPKTVDDRLRIRARVEVNDRGCWVWTGAVRAGYGQATVWRDDRWHTRLAHRVSYEAFIGPIPEGLELDHLCRNTACVKPQHLEAVTRSQNVLRANDAKRAA